MKTTQKNIEQEFDREFCLDNGAWGIKLELDLDNISREKILKFILKALKSQKREVQTKRSSVKWLFRSKPASN